MVWTTEYGRAWRARNREYKRLKDAEYYRRNKDKIIANVRMWTQEHPDRVKEYKKKYHENAGRMRNYIRSKKCIRFLGKVNFYLGYNPRTGKCSDCGRIDQGTDMHHELGYFIIFPWFGIKELCDTCHIGIMNSERHRLR